MWSVTITDRDWLVEVNDLRFKTRFEDKSAHNWQFDKPALAFSTRALR